MSAAPTPPAKNRWSWRSQAFRALVYQVLAVGVIALLVWFLAHNTATNMRQRGIQSGFGFLLGTAGFDIGESLYAFDSSESYLQAYLVGVTNTLRVAIVGMVLTTLLGTRGVSDWHDKCGLSMPATHLVVFIGSVKSA